MVILRSWLLGQVMGLALVQRVEPLGVGVSEVAIVVGLEELRAELALIPRC